MTSRSVLLVAGFVLVALPACSGDDSTDSADDVAAAEVSPTTVATTVPPVPTTIAAPTTTAPVPPEESFDEWCALATEVEAVDTLGDELDPTDPVAIEEYFTALLPLLDEAVAIAPDEIADAVRVSAEIAGEANDALAEVGYDLLAVDLSAIGARDDENDAANEAIEIFNESECGIPRDPDDEDGEDGDGFDPEQGSLRDQFIADLVADGFTDDEAACIFSEIDFSSTPSLQDPDVITAIFDACDISLERLAEIGSIAPGDDSGRDSVSDATGGVDGDAFAEVFVAALVEDGFTEVEATCILDELGTADVPSDDDTIAAMDACGISAGRIAELIDG